MTDPKGNREKSERIRRRYRVHDDSGQPESPDKPGETMFGPPPPKADLFHRDDSPEGGLDSPPCDLADPFPRTRADDGGKPEPAHDERYDYQLPYKDSGKDMPWRSWLYGPITGSAVFATLLVLFFMTPHGSPWRWVMYIVGLIYVPYMIINRPRGYRYYNTDWEPDAEPTGCFDYRRQWWRWWWW